VKIPPTSCSHQTQWQMVVDAPSIGQIRPKGVLTFFLLEYHTYYFPAPIAMIWSRQTTQASVCAILLCISRGALGHHFRIGSPRIVEGSSSTAYTFPRDKIHVFTVRQTICHSRTRRSVAEVSLLRCRGGAASFVANYFSASRTRCWAVLLIAIVTDVFTTTMMKVAQDEGSILKLAMSYAGYFIRYVHTEKSGGGHWCLVLFSIDLMRLWITVFTLLARH